MLCRCPTFQLLANWHGSIQFLLLTTSKIPLLSNRLGLFTWNNGISDRRFTPTSYGGVPNNFQWRSYAEQDNKIPNVDPKRVVSYEDMLRVLQEPNRKVIIDVRNPDEIYTTGMIPSSINIPCNVPIYTLTILYCFNVRLFQNLRHTYMP